jgi:alginate O-acetyltransferase complex protein AlgI
MPFSSLLFVCGFLPICLAAHWVSPQRARNYVLLAFSIFFYAWGAPKFLPVVLALGVADYFLAKGIARAQDKKIKKALLVLGICVHLSILAYFKYANFFVAQVNAVRGSLGAPALRWSEVALPIGISFLTFEEMSYLLDVYRGDAPPANRWSHYLLFLMLFPHSIAGPIFRWKDLASQFSNRKATFDSVAGGVYRFSFGLAKKILVADCAAYICDQIFGLPKAEISPMYAWIGALAYTIQIYFDFSGYSDMAIGLGKMLGFDFKENFNEPYVSRSITEFWTRWHMSLTAWLRDYLYIPLGGNRRGRARAELNAMIVFAVSGFWHGAAWTFLVWGLYHGALVALERRIAPKLEAVPGHLRAIGTFVLVVIGWVPFRASTVRQMLDMLQAMVGLSHQTIEPRALTAQIFPRFNTIVFFSAVAYVLVRMLTIPRDPEKVPRPGAAAIPLRPLVSLALLALSVMHMTNTRYTPLIYFKF